MKDLFNLPESKIALEQVQDFLMLDAPDPNQRPAEGVFLDYKSRLPTDVAKHVVAFANTYGGIVFLGVEEKHGRPIRICGVKAGRSDLKTAIANSIKTGVHPPFPAFDIVTFALPDGNEIGLVRVAQGTGLPHQHTNGAAYVRMADQSPHVAVPEILRLVRIRGQGTRPSFVAMPDIWIKKVDPGDGQLTRSDTFARLTFSPLRKNDRRFDRRVELSTQQTLTDAFGLNSQLVSHSPYKEWCFRHDGLDLEQRWAIQDDGRSCYVTQAVRDSRGLLQPLIDELATACVCAATLVRGWGYEGLVDTELELQTRTAPIIGDVAEGNDRDEIHRVSREPLAGVAIARTTVQTGELDEPGSMLAELLFERIRTERGASIDFEPFSVRVSERANARASACRK